MLKNRTVKNPTVGLRFNEVEKAALVELTARFHRSQTDVLATLTCEFLAALKEQDAQQVSGLYPEISSGEVQHGNQS